MFGDFLKDSPVLVSQMNLELIMERISDVLKSFFHLILVSTNHAAVWVGAGGGSVCKPVFGSWPRL